MPKMQHNGWTEKDPTAEQEMRKLGIGWKMTFVPVEKVNEDKSKKNMARADGIDHDVVSEYARALKTGDEMPPIVVYLDTDGRYVILSGNHRFFAAKKCERGTLWCYVAQTEDPMLLNTAITTLNLRHGPRLSKDEVLRRANDLVERYGRTADDVCKDFGIDPSALKRFRRVENVKTLLLSNGQKPSDRLGSSHYEELARVPYNSVLIAAHNLAHSAKLSKEELGLIVTEAKKKRSEHEALGVVLENVEKYKVGEANPNPGPRRPMAQKLRRWLTTGENLLKDKKTWEQFQLTEESQVNEVKDQFARVKKLYEKLR